MLSNISSAKNGATVPLTDNIAGGEKVCRQEQASNATLLACFVSDKKQYYDDWMKVGVTDKFNERKAQSTQSKSGDLGTMLQRAWLQVNRPGQHGIGTELRNSLLQVLPQPTSWVLSRLFD
jgi:hypothetical protein